MVQGGHLFPALFIAEAIKAERKDVEIRFIGTGRPLEEKIIGEAGYHVTQFKGVKVKHTEYLGPLIFLILLPFLLLHCIFILLVFKPDVVVGVGASKW